MSAFCPHCGFDISLDQPMSVGEVDFDPRGDVRWRGQVVHLDPSKRQILLTLLKAAPRTVSRAVLAARVGYEGLRIDGVVSQHICAIRKALPGAPIETVRCLGMRWAA